MASIKGDLIVMPLTDLLEWVYICKKTGTIHVNNRYTEKQVHLDKGNIIFVSSNKDGERLGEYLKKNSHLEIDKIKSVLSQSQTMKISFTKRLIDLNYFSLEQLTDIIIKHAKEILLDAMDWPDGTFEFIQDEIPSYVLRGPITLNTTELTYQVYKQLEEIKLGFKKTD